MRTFRLVLVLCTVLGAAALAVPPAQATDCLPTGIPACPEGSVPWPRSSSNSCGSHGASWGCAWLW